MNRVMIFTMHGTTPWWTYLGSQLNFATATVVSDTRGDGDMNVVHDFYQYYRSGTASCAALAAYGEDGTRDIIRRCRVLRGLKPAQALAMVGAMHQALLNVFDLVKPTLCLSFTIDRYVMDLMARIAKTRGVRFIEMTTSILPGEVMFLERGRPIALGSAVDSAAVDAKTEILYNPDFAPTYVKNAKRFGYLRFWQIVSYFQLRGQVFNLTRHASRDPLNFHYVEAQSWLPHKIALQDAMAVNAWAIDWKSKLEAVPRENRVFLGLQLHPEASMDYWLRDPGMLEHDEVIVSYIETLGGSGFHVFVKDHPLQFGFRKRAIIECLLKSPYVTLVPYHVPAAALIATCSVSVTQTGTIGFQAALAGLCSVVTEPYYATPDHYVHIKNANEISKVVDQVEAWQQPRDMVKARHKLVTQLARISAPGDYFTFQKFNAANPTTANRTQSLIQTLNRYLPTFIE